METIVISAKVDVTDENCNVRTRFEHALAFAGFQKTRVAANDETYELPPNQYVVTHRGTTDDVASRIFAAANAADVTRMVCVLVVESSSTTDARPRGDPAHSC